MCRRPFVFCLGSLSLFFALASAAAANEKPTIPLDVEKLAERIDGHLARKMKETGIAPAPLIDDAAFLRRVYLDLAGCIPSILDIRDFLDDPRPNKRRIWVDAILDSKKPSRKPDAFSRHFANVYRAAILARVNEEIAVANTPALESWLRNQFESNVPYDRMVRELIGDETPKSGESAGSIYYRINDNKPENLAANTSSLFLGIKLECAQCHDDRSGGNWSQDQFWSFAAFFAGNSPEGETSNKKEIVVPGRKQTVSARFLDDSEPKWKPNDNPRVVLAEWLVAPNNPYFTRTAVNRLWSYFFGTGLTDPIDEQGAHNPPSHPELLDELSQQFIAHHFDLKYMIKAIVSTDAYQRSSVTGDPRRDDPRLFARAFVRGLSAEQLFDSLAEATEYENYRVDSSARFDNPENQTPRQRFLARFAHRDKPTEATTSILQALYLMNSSFVAERTSLSHNKTLATIADSANTSTERRIETLYLVSLSRKPSAAELKRLVAYIERGGPTGDRRTALADLFWALLNGPEFRLNH